MIREQIRKVATVLTTACLVMSPLADAFAAKPPNPADTYTTATPIKHIVVVFNENISFDHYFATYPYATNPAGEPQFTALPNTPRAATSSASSPTARRFWVLAIAARSPQSP